MEKEKLESMIIDLIEGNLNQSERELIEKVIAGNEEARHTFHQTKELFRVMERVAEVEPNHSLKNRFEQELQTQIDRKGKIISFGMPTVYKMAAGIALLVCGALVYRVGSLQIEVRETKSLMMAMLNNQNSAGQRIQGTTVAFQMDKADDEIVNALVKAMDTDPNTNVRLAAVDALSKFHKQPHVRKALIKSLGTQTDASVQIALIRLLVEIKEKQTLDELKRISTDDTVIEAVQDEAHIGIMKLS